VRSQPNLLLISVDCLRWDALSCAGQLDTWAGKPPLPTLDRLCSSAAVFPVTITAAPFTTPSHASIFSGQYPFEHGVRLLVNQHLPANVATLAELLPEWDSVAIPSVFVLNRNTGLLRGFRTVYDCRDEIPTARRGSRRDGATVHRLLRGWLADHGGRPWFAFLHYFDAHSRGQAPTKASYLNGLARIDALLAELFDLVDLSDTLVCVFGDHGEGLGDGEPAHGRTLSEAVIRVPVVLAGRAAPSMCWQMRRTIDIAPTLMRLLGRPVPRSASGTDLFDDRPRLAYIEACPYQLFGADQQPSFRGPERVGLRTDDLKLERTDDGLESLRRVHCASNREILVHDPDRSAAVRAHFEPHFAAFPAFAGTERFDRTYLDDPAIMARLQALGYLEQPCAMRPA